MNKKMLPLIPILVLTYFSFFLSIYLIYFLTENLFFLLRFFIYFGIVLGFTTIFHFALASLFRRIRNQEEETIIEHFILYFLAYLIWCFIDFFFLLRTSIFTFLVEKIIIFLLTFTLVFSYSLFYLALVKDPTLIMDISGFVLAIGIGGLVEIIFIFNRTNPLIIINILVIILVIISALSIFIIFYIFHVGQIRGKKYQLRVKF